MNSRPLLITSNGFGMGHLVRQLAISRNFEHATIMTLSGAAPLALNNGAHLEYCPSYTTPWISKRAWHRGYLEDRIICLAEEVQADVIVFDGVVPYIGLLNAMKKLNLPSVWMRRGVWRSSAKTWPLKYSGLFDLVIEPGDIGKTRDKGPTKNLESAHVGVITEAGGMLPREDAAKALGVDPDKKTLLINVGSTSGVDFSSVAFPNDWNVIATSDALGRARSTAQIKTVSGLFPLHPYLSAVDLAITSVGYNAAHEFVACAVPTIVVPSDNATDDQYARADAMVELGVSLRSHSPKELAEHVALWSSDDRARGEAAQRAADIASKWGNGARDAAQLISGVERRAHKVKVRQLLRNLVEKLLSVRDARKPGPALFTEKLEAQMLRGEVPVEHLLSGSSAEYLRRREALANKWLESKKRA